MSIISVRNLSKHYQVFERREGLLGSVKDLFHRDYKTLKAVNDISFEINPGEVVGYIGPNGAGKSTTIKMLTGILNPTSGQMNVLGFEPSLERKRYTKHIGVVFGQRTQLWWDIAVIESLKLLARIYDVAPGDFQDRLASLDQILELKDILRKPVRKLSLGQRMRCDLAASLIHDPSILFLDEPTIGLDAVAKHNVRAFLKRINNEFNTTIILTTHDMTEIEELCKRIIIIDQGNIIYDGSLEQVKQLPGVGRRVYVDFADEVSSDQLAQICAGSITFSSEGKSRWLAGFDPGQITSIEIMRELMENFDVVDFTVTEPGIEEVVMKIYKEGIVEAQR